MADERKVKQSKIRLLLGDITASGSGVRVHVFYARPDLLLAPGFLAWHPGRRKWGRNSGGLKKTRDGKNHRGGDHSGGPLKVKYILHAVGRFQEENRRKCCGQRW